ncbi:cell wall-associated NlpC family hydrolase [Weissella uvarum]|uniref:C40 family peptidase n=1 Tax=Weissella uvarum TaxID=1479233 RepID=UPI00196002D2|nr:C40 family peptidase [Weissella uvarum]MBM7617864.1 cell wall-associated NlpC family hydrolase [Weissella uvarum]MCM0596138.1 LysM peptidoglycan-binding domain-containing protein [Weissella uvarum]
MSSKVNVSLAVASAATGVVAFNQTEASADKIEVKQNDSVKKIANRYGAKVQNIVAENGIDNDHKLTVGEDIEVQKGRKRIYTVKANDSLSKIAQRHHVSIERLMELNKISNQDVIYVGQKLFLGYETPKGRKQPLVRVPVKEGDTLKSIAQRYSTDEATVKKLNPKADFNALKKDMTLVVNVDKLSKENATEATMDPNDGLLTSNGAPTTTGEGNTAVTGGVKTDSAQRNAIVKMALNLTTKNIPYVWGGESMSGMDCSGLVQYVFGNAVGAGVPRTSQEQSKVFQKIAVKDAQPGDLLFWDETGSNAHHVAIYIGNNQYVAAPTFGYNVRVETISAGFMPSYAGSLG